LAITLDRAILKNGEEILLNVAIQALASIVSRSASDTEAAVWAGGRAVRMLAVPARRATARSPV